MKSKIVNIWVGTFRFWAVSSVNWFCQNWFPKFEHFDWLIAKLVLKKGVRGLEFCQLWGVGGQNFQKSGYGFVYDPQNMYKSM